jgi:hypothetical protein
VDSWKSFAVSCSELGVVTPSSASFWRTCADNTSEIVLALTLRMAVQIHLLERELEHLRLRPDMVSASEQLRVARRNSVNNS